MALPKTLSWDDVNEKFLQYASKATEQEKQTLAVVNMVLDIAKTHEEKLTAAEQVEIYRFTLKVIGEDCFACEEDEDEE